MEKPITDEQRWAIQETFSRALDCGVSSSQGSSHTFAHIVLSHFLGGLTEMNVLQSTQLHHFRTLSDLYASTPQRKGVK